jgi:hypothetical protein
MRILGISEVLMNRWDISLEQWEEGRKAWPLESKKLENAIWNFIQAIEIGETKTTLYQYCEFISSDDPLVISCIKKEYTHADYEAKFSFSIQILEAVEWAASYRTLIIDKGTRKPRAMRPGDKKANGKSYPEQFEDDISGFLGELFLFKLFKLNRKEFKEVWAEFIRIAALKENGEWGGDDGYDLKFKENPKDITLIYIDSKTINLEKSKGGINLGSVIDEYTPKIYGLLIVPIYIRWSKDKSQATLTAQKIIDTTDYWNLKYTAKVVGAPLSLIDSFVSISSEDGHLYLSSYNQRHLEIEVKHIDFLNGRGVKLFPVCLFEDEEDEGLRKLELYKQIYESEQWL